jgi:UDP-N-acetylglucosamine--N-acetylmuramyl-(pentapeptide) pyrophosphoryl-undecaprenol N-acetylglucosamine transferase
MLLLWPKTFIEMIKKYIISGGGTGGHIFPAIAIANILKKDNNSCEILFVGAEGKMEMQKIPEAGYQIKGLPIAGLQRSLSLKNLLLPFKIIKSLLMAIKIVSNYKPQLIVGVGGYASAPVLFAAIIKNIPFIIQEQNSYAGITNKILGKWAKNICVAYTGMELFFDKNKIEYTGNPVRQIIANNLPSKLEARQYFDLDVNRKTILIIGGSLGARTINKSIDNGLNILLTNDVQIIWQTGKGYFKIAQKSISNLKVSFLNSDVNNELLQSPIDSLKIGVENIKCFDFVKNMEMAYAAADVIISRAGALSVSELCIVGKPCILVPSPNVAEDHQTKNAQSLVSVGAAILVKDIEAEGILVSKILELLKNNTLQENLSNAIKKMAVKDADNRILEVIKTIV